MSRDTRKDCRQGDTVPTTEPCDVCSGKGRQTIRATEISVRGRTESSVEINCLDCKGRGVVPLGANEARARAHREFWCSCADSEFGAWHEDGECPACDKHHAHCARCGKITQVG